MKPNKKNLIYCPACGGCKLQFETKLKADRFISYNHDEILATGGKAPVRSYYCKTCCAWHVTSRKKFYSSVDPDSADGHQMKSKSLKLRQSLDKADMYLKRGDYDKACEQLRFTTRLLECMPGCRRELYARFKDLTYFTDILGDIIRLDDEQRDQLFADNTNPIIADLSLSYHNYCLGQYFSGVEKEISHLARKGDSKALKLTFDKLALVKLDFKGEFEGALTAEYSQRTVLLRRLYSPLFNKTSAA